jgi:ABC-type Na+ efflux pump permease subunit
MFICHLVFILVITYLLNGNLEITGGYTIPHSLMAIFLYYFVFGFWGYLFLSAIYLFILNNDQRRSKRYLKGLFIVVLGYFLSRIPDIIDDDFFNRFSWQAVFSFLLLIPILVEVELWLKPKIDKRT